MSKRNIARVTILFTVIMCIGYIVSFAKEAIVANYFGISKAVDAYTIALQVPVILFSFVSVAIQSVVVPLYSDLLYKQGKEKSDAFASNLLITILLLAAVFFIVGECFASGIVYVFAPGFETETHALATKLLRITLPTIFFSLLSQVLTAVLNVYKKFILPSVSVLVLNVGLIVTIILLHAKYGIVAACLGQVIGGVFQSIFLLFLVKRHFHWTIVFDPKDATLKRAIKMSLPVFWSISIAEVNAMINKMVASFLFVGSIAALGYAQKINFLFISFFTSAITTIVYPMYAESAAKGDTNQLNHRINMTLSAYSFFLIPVMLYVLCYREEIIRIAFARGAFDTNAIDVTQQLLGYYVLGILFLAQRGTITNIFYSLKDSKTPAKNATVGVIINVVLNLTLPYAMGINGLAVATTITSIYITSALLYLLLKKHKELSIHFFVENLKGITSASLVAFAAVLVTKFCLGDLPVVLSLIAGVLSCIAVYLLIVLLLRVPIAVMMTNALFHRLK